MDEVWQPPPTVHLLTGITYAAGERVWPTAEHTNFGHLKTSKHEAPVWTHWIRTQFSWLQRMGLKSNDVPLVLLAFCLYLKLCSTLSLCKTLSLRWRLKFQKYSHNYASFAQIWGRKSCPVYQSGLLPWVLWTCSSCSAAGSGSHRCTGRVKGLNESYHFL